MMLSAISSLSLFLLPLPAVPANSVRPGPTQDRPAQDKAEVITQDKAKAGHDKAKAGQDKTKAAQDKTKRATTEKTKEAELVDGYSITTKRVKPRPIVSIRIQCKLEELSQQFQINLPKVFAFASENGGEFAGQPLAIYHSAKQGMVDVEMAAPLVKPIPGEGDIKAGTLYGGHVAATFHLGSYHELGKAHNAVQKWFKQNEVTPAASAPWEVYTSDPTKVKPDEVRTDLFFPIKGPPKAKVKAKAKAKAKAKTGAKGGKDNTTRSTVKPVRKNR